MLDNTFYHITSDRSYRNKKSHEIWGCLEVIFRVLGLIYGRGVNPIAGGGHPMPPMSKNVKLFLKLFLGAKRAMTF